MERPHVVILGAGASRAACLSGDKNGRKLPVMADLIDVLELKQLPVFARFAGEDCDFEAIYSRMVNEGTPREDLVKIENRILKYFESLELNEQPTLYDRLVLSLRKKDIIASFNWDPLLVQAIARNQQHAPMPQTLFLHGNVAIGYCSHDPKMYVGAHGNKCRICRNDFMRPPLLFPVTKKNYQSDYYISKAWGWLQQELEAAYLLTIFGYRAPVTDVEAHALLMNAWDPNKSSQFKTMEIIDISCPTDLENTWHDFFPTSYYRLHNSFDDSILNRYPRRSCESIFGIEMDGFDYAEEIGEHHIPNTADWPTLRRWFTPLVEAETN